MFDRWMIQSAFSRQYRLTTWLRATPSDRKLALSPFEARIELDRWLERDATRGDRCDIYAACMCNSADFTRLSNHELDAVIRWNIEQQQLLLIPDRESRSSVKIAYQLRDRFPSTPIDRQNSDKPIEVVSDAGNSDAGNSSQPKPRWTVEEIKAYWRKTPAGQKALSNLPPSTKFKGYAKAAGEQRNAYYSPRENAIYIPDEYTSLEAAPTAAHEAVHADQTVNHGRPTDRNDLIEMEIEAKHVGLDVYQQLGEPRLPYNYSDELRLRTKDIEKYNNLVRETYRRNYNIK